MAIGQTPREARLNDDTPLALENGTSDGIRDENKLALRPNMVRREQMGGSSADGRRTRLYGLLALPRLIPGTSSAERESPGSIEDAIRPDIEIHRLSLLEIVMAAHGMPLQREGTCHTQDPAPISIGHMEIAARESQSISRFIRELNADREHGGATLVRAILVVKTTTERIPTHRIALGEIIRRIHTTTSGAIFYELDLRKSRTGGTTQKVLLWPMKGLLAVRLRVLQSEMQWMITLNRESGNVGRLPQLLP